MTTPNSRPDGRKADELRPIEIITNFQKHAEGSVLIKSGDTWVLCAVSVEEGTPSFVTSDTRGWLTAEYAMLPRATHTRNRRSPGGRGKEIQRLIGRSLRTAINLDKLGPRTITVDCDVLQADGGTRVASITGAYVAIALAVQALHKQGKVADPRAILGEPVAAISVGIVHGQPLLDLPYEEDSIADVDMNIVMTQSGKFIEIQGTAEKEPFSQQDLLTLTALAKGGIEQICRQQLAAIEQSR